MKDNISFEDALESLESIVDQLEKGSKSIEEAVKLYTEGSMIINMCKEKLEQAEKEVNMLENGFNVGAGLV